MLDRNREICHLIEQRLMGYDIQAIVSTLPILEAHCSDFAQAVVVPLAENYGLIPMTDELLDEVGVTGPTGTFYKLTFEVTDWIRAISASGAVAYIEAEFFGGVGNQNATVWSSGEAILPPIQDPKAINMALRLLGVSKGSFHDEFEAMGLPRHRGTDDWIVDALPRR